MNLSVRLPENGRRQILGVGKEGGGGGGGGKKEESVGGGKGGRRGAICCRRVRELTPSKSPKDFPRPFEAHPHIYRNRLYRLSRKSECFSTALCIFINDNSTLDGDGPWRVLSL